MLRTLSIFLLLLLVKSSISKVIPNTVFHCALDSRVEVEETVVDSQVMNLYWMEADQVVLARTKLSNLYRSTDDGTFWEDQKDKLIEAKAVTAPNDINNYGTLNVFLVGNPQKTVFIQGKGTDMWLTTDSGKTYIYHPTPIPFLDLKPHPMYAFTALASGLTAKCSNASVSGTCNRQLYYTTNGKNWHLIAEYIGTYFWGQFSKIWFDQWDPQTGTQQMSDRWNYNLRYSSNFGSSSQLVMSHIGGFIMKFNSLFIAQLTSITGKTLRLYSSRNLGEADVTPAILPANLTQTRFTILDTDDNFIFISVEHEDSDYGNLYVSDETDKYFSLSLERNKRDVYGHCDLEKVKRVSGIYIANVVSQSQTEEVYSVITFNNGGQWNPVKAPEFDSLSNTINCPNCTLNFHGVGRDNDASDQFGPIYSNENAVGLIFATGNVGTKLSNYPDDVNTFFSRDAGQTWKEIRKGSHIYEFGDHGAILVMADNKEDTNTILYSWNEALSWTECRFTDDGKLSITNITSDPSTTSQTFILHGTRLQDNREKGVIVHLDFTNLHQASCEPSDYELWSPSDAYGEGCILGQTVAFSRRKQDSECFNGEDYEVVSSTIPCPCTQLDYECDVCFEPYHGDSTYCVAVGCDLTRQTNCPESGYWMTSRGYRLVDGDKCDPSKGLDLLPVKTQCNIASQNYSSIHSHSRVGLVVGLIVLLLLAMLVIVLALLIRANPRMRAWLSSRMSNVTSRLPRGLKDPFEKVPFIRLDNVEDDDLDFPNAFHEATELDDETILKFTKPSETQMEEQ